MRRPSDGVVAQGEPPCGGGEAEHGERGAVAVVDGVAHPGADQGRVAEVVVAGDELVPQLVPARVPRTTGRRSSGRTSSRVVGAGNSGGSVSCPKTIGPGRFCRHFGGGRAISPSRCMASIVTLAIMSLSPPSGLYQPMRRQNSFDRAKRFSGGRPAMSARSSAISSTVKSRP